VTIEGHAMGRSAEDLVAEMLRLLGPQADVAADGARLRLVGAADSDHETPSHEKEKR